jgi:hypothetical protein
MAAKKNTSTSALVKVIDALETLDNADRQWVLQAAASKFALSMQTLPTGLAGGGSAGGQPHLGGGASDGSGAQRSIKQLDVKTFMKGKNPNSDIQRVACLAYYLNHARDVTAFKTADITRLNVEARGRDFNITRAIDNASRATTGYLSPIGKGQKQLSAFGEEIVEALPSQETVKVVEANRKATKRGSKKKRGKKGPKGA